MSLGKLLYSGKSVMNILCELIHTKRNGHYRGPCFDEISV